MEHDIIAWAGAIGAVVALECVVELMRTAP
jgi:hypothetical protein